MIKIIEVSKQPTVKEMLMNIANNNEDVIEEFSISKIDGKNIITFILEEDTKSE